MDMMQIGEKKEVGVGEKPGLDYREKIRKVRGKLRGHQPVERKKGTAC